MTGKIMQWDNDQYKVLFEQCPDALLIADPETLLPVCCSDRALEMLGYTREEFTARKITDCQTLESAATMQAHVRNVQAVGTDAFESVFRTKSGESRTVLISIQTVPIDGKDYLYTLLQDIAKQRTLEKGGAPPDDLFLHFGPDFHCNINLVTRAIGTHMGATCALYNRLGGGLLSSVGQWQTPADFQAEDTPEGHICYDVIRSGTRVPLLIRNLRKTVYAQTDANVTKYNLHTYVGYPVYWGETAVGSLCAVYDRDVVPSPSELSFLAMGALAIGVEEARLRAKESQGESDSRMRAVTDSARDAIIMIDQNGIISYWNPAAERILGYSGAEALGKDLHRLIAPQRYRERHDTAFPKFQATGQGHAIDATLELEACHKDGHEIAIDLSLSRLQHKDGWHTVGVIRDITERKQTEEALKKSEYFFKESQRAAAIGSYRADFTVDRWESSEVLDTIFGIDKDYDRSVQGWLDIIHPDDRNMMKRYLMKEVMAHQKPFSKKYRINRIHDGATRWVDGQGTSTFDSHGNPLSLIGTIQDITERMCAEEENKLLQAKLLQAQKMEAIGTLAGGIAHDFNNILGAILGYAEIARDDTIPGSSAAKSLDKVLEASQRAATLVKQILTFSRQANIERVPLQLSHIVKEATRLLRPTLPSTIEIRQQIDPATRPVLADPTQVHQILMNLCTNAYHAMEQTGGTLDIILKDCELSPEELRYKPEVDPGRFAVLSVGDTGPGIAPKIRARIFDPYFTTKEVGKGTGMGLSIVHGIVTSYGGLVRHENRPGNGTVFHIYFPAIEENVAPAVKPADGVPLGKEHILFIDDEEMLAHLGKAMLEHLGYEVTARTSSLEALALFQNQPDLFDAVITDQTMPGLTGIDLARHILQIRPDIPIILCTGYSTLVSEEQAQREGLKGFAMKPLSKKMIATLLRKVLDQEGRRHHTN